MRPDWYYVAKSCMDAWLERQPCCCETVYEKLKTRCFTCDVIAAKAEMEEDTSNV